MTYSTLFGAVFFLRLCALLLKALVKANYINLRSNMTDDVSFFAMASTSGRRWKKLLVIVILHKGQFEVKIVQLYILYNVQISLKL